MLDIDKEATWSCSTKAISSAFHGPFIRPPVRQVVVLTPAKGRGCV